MKIDVDVAFDAIMSSSLGYKFISYYDKDRNNNISHLCDIYGSDKGELKGAGHPYTWASHTYADFYYRLFSHCRDGVRNVFECGIGTNNPALVSNMGTSGKPGASLRVWRDFFPNAAIYGADLDKDILFQEERIQTFPIDQLDPASIAAFWKKTGKGDFDFMLDDGLHTFEAGSTLFTHSIEHLSMSGVYIIEDVIPSDVLRYVEFFRHKDYIVEYVCMFRPGLPLGDNNLVVIRKRG